MPAPRPGPYAVLYHGTPHDFPAFDDTQVGHGHAQEGPGHYFTTSAEDAATYAGESGQLLTCLVPVGRLVSTTAPADPRVLATLLDAAPRRDLLLADWAEDFREARRTALAQMAAAEHEHEALQSMWYDFYRGDEPAYVAAVRAHGYDGVVRPRAEGVVHVIRYATPDLAIVARTPVTAWREDPTRLPDLVATDTPSPGLLDALANVEGVVMPRAPADLRAYLVRATGGDAPSAPDQPFASPAVRRRPRLRTLR